MPDMKNKNLERLRQATKVQTPKLDFDALPIFEKREKKIASWQVAVAAAAALVIGVTLTQTPHQPNAPLATLINSSRNIPATSSHSLYAYSHLLQAGLALPVDYDESNWLATAELIAGQTLSSETGKSYIFKMVPTKNPQWFFKRLQGIFKMPGKATVGKSEVQWQEPFSDKESLGFLELHTTGSGQWLLQRPSKTPVVADNLRLCSPHLAFDVLCLVPEPVKQSQIDNPVTSTKVLMRKSLEVFKKLGLDINEKDISLERQAKAIIVKTHLSLAGIYTAFEWRLVFNNRGEIVSASGYSAKAVKVGDYTTISQRAALKRFDNAQWSAITEPQIILSPFTSCYCIDLRKRPPSIKRPSFKVHKLNETLGVVFDTHDNVWLVPAYSLPEYPKRGVIALERGVFKFLK